MMSTAGNADLAIVTSPTVEWLTGQAKVCNSRMLIASPYVNDGILEFAKIIDTSLSRTLVTRTDLRDFAIGSSSLDTLCSLSRDGFVIRSLSNLHAKIYIFDNSAALVTSANATFSGMNHNWECGLGTNNSRIVTRLSRSLMLGLGSDRPPRIVPLKELESLHAPVATIRADVPQPPEIAHPAIYAPEPDVVYSVADNETLLREFRGWRRLTLQGVVAMPSDGFRMEDLLQVCAPLASRQYPRNRNVDAKLRQQLQDLRDLGMVEFVDNRGLYRYTLRKQEEGASKQNVDSSRNP